MRFPHLFEFMDQDWVPGGLRNTLVEMVECCNSPPFQTYYHWVADETLQVACDGNFTTIVELGAGSAPITRVLVKDPRSNSIRLVMCDINPNPRDYEVLEKLYPGKVHGLRTPIDISHPHQWDPRTILVLSATFHHIPPPERSKVLMALTNSAERIMIFEPVRKSLLSVLFVFTSLIPSLLLPLFFFQRPGKLRRFLWCWLVPVAPLMFWWEGIISSLRQWSDWEWRTELEKVLSTDRKRTVKSWKVYQMVVW
jgi:hypothetical protein